MYIALEEENGLNVVHATIKPGREHRKLMRFISKSDPQTALTGERGSLLTGSVSNRISTVLTFAAMHGADGCDAAFIHKVNRLRDTDPGLALRVSWTNSLRCTLKPLRIRRSGSGSLLRFHSQQDTDSGHPSPTS